jgi:hypothetical protein
MGNLMVKVDMKEGPMMDNIELLEVWVNSGGTNLFSGKADGVI